MGRPEEEAARFHVGKWRLVETPRNAILAGGFDAKKLQELTEDHYWSFGNKQGVIKKFSVPMWFERATATWTEEQKAQWGTVIEGLLTEDEKATGGVPMFYTVHVAQK